MKKKINNLWSKKILGEKITGASAEHLRLDGSRPRVEHPLVVEEK